MSTSFAGDGGGAAAEQEEEEEEEHEGEEDDAASWLVARALREALSSRCGFLVLRYCSGDFGVFGLTHAAGFDAVVGR